MAETETENEESNQVDTEPSSETVEDSAKENQDSDDVLDSQPIR